MLQFRDFPDVVAGVQSVVLTWDFELPTGVRLTGTPTVTVSVVSGTDASASSRIGSPTVGTAEYKSGSSGQDNAAIQVQFSSGANNVRYLLTVSCNRSDTEVAAAFNHIYSRTPA